MPMCFFFFFAKSTPKLRHFSDDQVKSLHASKLHSFKPKLKIKTSSLNDIVLGQILKSNNKDHEELTSLTQTLQTQTPWLRLNPVIPSTHFVNPGNGGSHNKLLFSFSLFSDLACVVLIPTSQH